MLLYDQEAGERAVIAEMFRRMNKTVTECAREEVLFGDTVGGYKIRKAIKESRRRSYSERCIERMQKVEAINEH